MKKLFESNYTKIAAFIAFAIITAVLMFSRYLTMGIDPTAITGFIVVYVIACLLLIASTYYFKNPLNPINYYTIFILCYGFHFIKLSGFSIDLSSSTHLIIVLSILFFILGTLSGNKIKAEQKVLMTQQSKSTIFYITLLCIILTFIIEVITFGYLPITKMLSMDVYNDTTDKLVSFLHYFIICAAIIPSWAYILFKKEIISKKTLIYSSIITLFILINYLSRQIFFLFLISAFVTYTFYFRISYLKIGAALILAVFLFIFMGNIRVFKGDSILSNYTAKQALRDLGGIKYKTNIYESYMNNYSSQRFNSMEKFVQMKKRDNFFGMGIYTFRPVVSFLFIDRIGMINYNQFDIRKDISTYAIDPYLDFGLLGVIILNFLYGFICRLAFINFNEGNTLYIIPWAILIFCLIMAPFANYFNSLIVWLAIIFNRLILK